MVVENTYNTNAVVLSEKTSFTGAVVNLRKLLKTVKAIFKHTKASNNPSNEITATHSCMTEEEYQNWLNEQVEGK
ncbi:BobA [Drosophila busckii]|uniref:BobA n=1 Tax=Drosophila busckii TaxID=30019 RepID=A0A0M4EIS1_DROBS|nr:uncharacterized protein LOC108598085 [Drosophila busckii]ALC43814.1 BobA [Drosophila busckii]